MKTASSTPCARRKTPLARLVPLALLLVVSGCGGSDEIQIKEGSCPLPPSLADEAKAEMKKFSAEVTGIVKAVAGGSASGEIQGNLEKHYPDAHDVNRIYALSYTACVACRMDPKDVKGCADGFHEIINANHAKREEAVRSADAYRKQVVSPLQGSPAAK